MKLSQLFSGEVRTDNTAHAPQPTPAQAELMNRQIRSLVPGQTISGEIIARNGNEVQIRLSEDMVLNARVDRNLNIEIGKNMTFEVKNNGSSLTLSPLFTNVSTDVNVLKALDMAGLPVNRTSVDMTEQLMAAGLPVNKGTLQQIFREINSFPQGTVSDIINLHKLQMPVNETNVNQMASYRNMNHQLVGGMETILGELPEVFDSMMEQGDMPGAVRLYQEVLQLVRGEIDSLPSGEAPIPGTTPGTGGETSTQGQVIVLSDISQGTAEAEILQTAGLPGGLEAAEEAGLNYGAESPRGFGLLAEGGLAQGTETAGVAQNLSGLQAPENGQGAEALTNGLRAEVAREVLGLLDNLNLPSQEASEMSARIMQFAQGQTGAAQLFADISKLAQMARTSSGAMHALGKLLSGGNFRALLTGTLRNSWTLDPREVAEPGRVEELYNRLNRQIKGLAQALENAGQTESTAFRAVSSMSQNVDFLQQLNQMYAYVQLPLRLQQRNAHGDLYVYSNKKNLASKDGNVSALLHLDMDHLGPVDVYVAMQNTKVNTKFYLRDDEMIDFMASHMDILTERLKKRGYDCTYAMAVREEAKEETTKGGLEPILRQEKGVVMSRYAFDVRT